VLSGPYTYLLLNLLAISAPFLLSFDKKVAYYKGWGRLFAGMAFMWLLFIPWDEWFTRRGVWAFNGDYLTGIYWGSLPFEEWLFFLAIPYATIFIYACLKGWLPDWGRGWAKPFIWLVTIFSAAMVLLFYDRIYTLVTFTLLPLMLWIHVALHGFRHLGRFAIMWIIHLIPFYIINGVLTAWPVVTYNDLENMGFRIWTVPFEDAFYSMLMLIMVLTVYEKRPVNEK
jgi:lycopene cyclase domain-containing protein